jgi:fatty-acyl-CoA synthase
MLRWNAQRRADAEALVDDQLRLTYSELDRAVDETASMLRALGCGAGTIVGVLGLNSARYVIDIFAIARVGAILLPLNHRLHIAELAFILEHAEADLLLADGAFSEVAVGLTAVRSLERVVLHDGTGDGEGILEMQALLASASEGRVDDAPVSFDEVCRIMYTSGTTARPKGVMTTWGNVAANQLGQILELELGPSDRALASGPLFHVAALEAPGHHILSIGGTLVIARSFDVRDVLVQAAAERITGMVLAGSIVSEMVRLEDLETYDLSALRYVIFGSVPPEVRAEFMDRLPAVRVVNTFGMTELTNGVTYLDAAHMRTKLGSCGSAFPYMEVAIRGDDGLLVGPDEPGEIVVRGPKVSPGYWRDPDATARAWTDDGWFRSGDLGYTDADGYLWFIDRIKDVIRSGGENIASAEVERVLLMHPAIAEVAVVAAPHPRWGETPLAYLVASMPDAQPSEDELIAFCGDQLARFKVPRLFAWVESLPRNASGKVLKAELRARARLEDPAASGISRSTRT